MDASARIIARLQTVTAEQVQAAAAKYFGDDQLTAAALRPLPNETNRRPRGFAAPAGDLR
jgi:zinc protease